MEEIINEIKNGEQPQQSSTLNAGEQQIIDETQTLSGSLMDKFKTVDALQNAYKNLEKEFTQKCQKVKELTDKVSALDNANAPREEQVDKDKEFKDFLQSQPQVQMYEDEISKVVMEEEVASTKNPYLTALTKVLSSKIVPYDKLVNDEDFLNNYIYNNEKINKNIVDKYLQDIMSKKAMPLIADFGGAGTVSSPVSKPKTILEAGKVAEAYFKN